VPLSSSIDPIAIAPLLCAGLNGSVDAPHVAVTNQNSGGSERSNTAANEMGF